MYLFDMDGTLIDSNDVWKDVDREFLARRGLPYTKAYYEGVAHTIFPLAAKFTKEFCNLPDSEEDIMAEWMELAKDAYAHVTVRPGVRVAERYGVEPETCTLFDDSLAACKGARSAKMRVVGVYDSFFAGDEKEMRSFCDVYIKSFEELLWKPEYRKD